MKISKVINLPVIDFHSHLSAEEIYNSVQHKTISNFLLTEDHYKWRLIKNNGFNFSPRKNYTKKDFFVFYDSIKNTINNPVKEWFILEMEDILNIKFPLSYDKNTLWDIANDALKIDQIKNIIELYNIELIYTTDDPCGNLYYHKKINNSSNFKIKVLPTYRADLLFEINDYTWLKYIQNLSKINNIKYPTNTKELLNLINISLKRFNKLGSKLTDISLSELPKLTKSYEEIENDINLLLKRGIIKGGEETKQNIQRWMLFNFITLVNKNKMIIQLHLGPKRNNSTINFDKYGKNIGCDSIGNSIDINILSNILNETEFLNQKFILYNSNPTDTYKLITLADSFNNIKVGPPWWFLDNKKNIKEFIYTFDSISVLGSFIGMTTDSRAFSSLSRHKWFREIVIDYLINNTDDIEEIKNIAEKIFYKNIYNFLQ